MKWNQMMSKRREAYPKIVADYESGMSAVELAHKYNLSRQRIHQILVIMKGVATPAKGKPRSLKLKPKKAIRKQKNGTQGPSHIASPPDSTRA